MEVPPISKPIIEGTLFVLPTIALPITPPAGPDKTESLPVNESESVRPPELCINSIGISPNSSFNDNIYFLRTGYR